jgi:hypothetical protein
MAVRFSDLRAGRSLPFGRFLVPISIGGLDYPTTILRLEGLSQLQNRITSWGIEPATFQLPAYWINKLLFRVPRVTHGSAFKAKIWKSIKTSWAGRTENNGKVIIARKILVGRYELKKLLGMIWLRSLIILTWTEIIIPWTDSSGWRRESEGRRESLIDY